MEGIQTPWNEILIKLAKKEKFEMKYKKGFQVGVVIATPPFPFDDPESFKMYAEDATVLFKKPNTDGVHIADIKLVENDWFLAGQSGYAVIATAHGITVDEARRRVYERVKNIMIPNMFYRTDIGHRWFNDSDRLQTWGYLY